MHITMRVACRIARACTREVATSVFTLAGLIVSAVAHAPCAVAFCSDAIQVIDSSTGIRRLWGKMEKSRPLEGADFTFLAVQKSVPIAHLRPAIFYATACSSNCSKDSRKVNELR